MFFTNNRFTKPCFSNHRFSKLFFIIPFTIFQIASSAPRLTIVFVVDQFAHHYIDRLKPYLKNGIGSLLDNGIVYDNAYFPHAMPATATGHAALSTGCFAREHGIIANSWFLPDGKIIKAENDLSPDAAVFEKNGTLKNYGKSAKNMMVPNISDQIILQQQIESQNHVFALSYKARAAIMPAGKLGKAIWFDDGIFTSSKAYFKTLPAWLINFNKEKKIDQPKTITWKHAHNKKTGAYDIITPTDYQFTSQEKSIINIPLSIPNETNKKKPYELMMMTPYANQLLLDLALECIDNNLTNNKKDKFVLWISLSSLDKLGHQFGPNSLEAIDMIYHLDKQLKRFMKKVETYLRKRDTLFILTADHGVAPIPNETHEKGIKSAHLIDEKNLLERANIMIEKKYRIKNIITNYKTPHFYFDEKIIATIKPKKCNKLINDLKMFFINEPGIINAWTTKELRSKTFKPTDLRSFYKNQLYPDRSGDLAIQLAPFCQTSKYKKGTAHRTPYEHNTHVPLVFYQKEMFEKKEITKRVSMLQFANTLANILEVPKPTSSTFDILPKIFD